MIYCRFFNFGEVILSGSGALLLGRFLIISLMIFGVQDKKFS